MSTRTIWFKNDTDNLTPLESAFYDAFMQDTLDVLPGAKGAAWLKEKATEQAHRHAGIVREYQKAHGITEISELAHKDLLDELASTRREAEAYRAQWSDTLNENGTLEQEIARLHDEIRVARTLIRAADKALS